MPRGRKKENRTLEEQLQAITEEIAACEENIKTLRHKRREIEKKIADSKKEELYKAVLESGKSIDEIIADLTGQQS